MQRRRLMTGRQLLIGTGLFLMLWLSAPSELHAGCGDYVTIGNSMSAHISSEKTPQKESNCHGASCSQKQQDFGLPIVPTPPKLRIQDTLVWLDSVARITNRPVEWLLYFQTTFPETEILHDIFHPPR